MYAGCRSKVGHGVSLCGLDLAGLAVLLMLWQAGRSYKEGLITSIRRLKSDYFS
ncbi:Hypothetical protein PSEBR_m718 [Pseudomonas brassicacearum subsp. brassicacearum NFM421]|uniref:Uncharacterized protein n=1 Tax=Pseudomonas brassicacearum (strain NFM421) TaxID=994484 RepID=F2KF66_PSEBN|nr:Hypothetical protein PSEBR_m718 [Pseudomonas brassicacearum subsp. brassicacearum NFM421]